MLQHSPVADYLLELGRELAFDPALSRRVRQEVEDHLQEAATAEPAESTINAEKRAIMQFGAPQKIAEQYRIVWLYRRMKRTGLFALCAILAAFGTMAGRVVWYGRTQWNVGPDLKSASTIIVPIDRCAFLTAIILGIVGSIIVSRPRLLSYTSASQSQMRHGQQLIAAAAAATAVAVICESILTSWRLAESHWTSNSLLPLSSLVFEIGIVVASSGYVRNTVRRTSVFMRHHVKTSGSGEAY